ncbi:MAG: polyphosphate:AMP phosphotransferase [Deltaproteobacteria bacterium]|jgi:polyphosphate:AMP phosphotransferase|nr:polyphosphate:AMP phosphotransferase [Deltaproteobacteria bacterium]MBW2529916.1 polyphosphate:AMP phosphotransferase [Deltaproteobacteria bacterium]
MFETAELGRKIDKEDFDRQVAEMRTRLLDLQQQLRKADFSTIILVNGVDGAGKGDVINLLNEWMDTRQIDTTAFDLPTEEERHRPEYWRYWMALPAHGRIGVFVGAWYMKAIWDAFDGKTTTAELDGTVAKSNAFEKTLADDGTLIIKLWLHLSEKAQRKRFKRLEKKRDTRWRVSKQDWKHHKRYGDVRRICERVLRESSTGEAPWFVIEATDPRYRNLTAARHVADAIERRLQVVTPPSPPKPQPHIDDPETILDALDLTRTVSKTEYGQQLERNQARLHQLARKARKKRVGVIAAFEGMDAAGKGGTIRRLTAALDARQYRVIPIAAPTDEEKAHHYLWRFWRHLPRLGRVTIFDRTWYGRVLVERVEGFATEQEWMRAYKEINDFEKHLVEHGVVLLKFWLQISLDEQLRRFEARERTPWKKYKITEEDYRNREKANQYEAAANEMIERTSTEYAPWTLVASENKRIARVQVLDTVCSRLEQALGQ